MRLFLLGCLFVVLALLGYVEASVWAISRKVGKVG